MLGLTLCFWIAAANTMAGWLYALSGIGVALFLLSAILPAQALKGITVKRSPIVPVHAGEALAVTVTVKNTTHRPKGLLLAIDRVPQALGQPVQVAIEAIAPHAAYQWHYRLDTQRRGCYEWDTLGLRTGVPLGLCWSRRWQKVPALAWVYPQILPLTHCPIADEQGLSMSQQPQPQAPLPQVGHEGSTRSLRSYRWGDPMRLVHWRSSARFNELRIRELERFGGDQTCLIGLDTHCNWVSDHFEQAVIVAASLYVYGTHHAIAAQLWSAQWGIVQGHHQVLELLAQIAPHQNPEMPNQPVIWLTADPQRIASLPIGSRYLLWPTGANTTSTVKPQSKAIGGITINPAEPLQSQLQRPLQRF